MAAILVTGVAGFIGSHIADHLLRGNNTVIGIDDLSAGYQRNIPKGVIFIKDDICNIRKYKSIMKDIDVVFNNAASKKNICLKDPARDMEVNGIGTYRLLQSAMDNGIKKFVHASTGSVYGEVFGETITEDTARNPVSFYGISKTAGETYVQYFHKAYGLNTTILRYFHVHGERQESNEDTGGVVAIFNERIKAGKPITIHGDGSQKRVFTHVSDIAEANVKAWHNPKATGQIYNCASSEQMTIVDLAQRLMEKYEILVDVKYKDPLPGDIYNFDVDCSAIQRDLGITFKPITEII